MAVRYGSVISQRGSRPHGSVQGVAGVAVPEHITTQHDVASPGDGHRRLQLTYRRRVCEAVACVLLGSALATMLLHWRPSPPPAAGRVVYVSRLITVGLGVFATAVAVAGTEGWPDR